MTPAFWDSSGVVPLCVHKQSSEAVRTLFERHSMVVWWATTVEGRSAFTRLLRMKQLSQEEYASAVFRLQELRGGWREVKPTDELRSVAERLLVNFPLKAADSLQLAAALAWAAGSPQRHIFISADAQLLEAARRVGFQVAPL